MFGLTCSPLLLNATVRYRLTKYIDLEEIKHVIKRLILNLYVHDSTTSFDELSDAIEFYPVAKSTLDDANFDDMDLAELNDYRKVLGLQWQLSTDKIVFKFYLSMNLLNC